MIGCLAAMNNNNNLLKTSNFKGITNSNNYIKQALNMYQFKQNNRKLDNLPPCDNNSRTHNLSHNNFFIRQRLILLQKKNNMKNYNKVILTVDVS